MNSVNVMGNGRWQLMERNGNGERSSRRMAPAGPSLRRAGIAGLVTAALGLAALAVALALSGCSSTPTKLDRALGTFTNVPMVTERPITNVVTVTNAVTVTNTAVMVYPLTNTMQFYVTNQVNQMVPVVSNVVTYSTNIIPIVQTNYEIARITNVVPAGTVTNVPQLTGPSAGAQSGAALASGVAGMWGYGGIAAVALSGLFGWYMKSRNATLAAAATGATAGQLAAQQAAGGLTQNIETLLNVLQQTPQGAQVMPVIKNYLMQHQTETGTIQTVAGLIQQYVDEPAAQQSAASILDALRRLQGQTAPAATRV